MADKATILSYELTMSELLKVFGEEGCLSKVSLKRKSVTPEKRQKRIKFAQVSPKAELMPTFECEYCPKKFGYAKTLRKHVKKSHPDEKLPDVSEIADKVTCRMCKVKQERDKINRHLRDVHGSTAPAVESQN